MNAERAAGELPSLGRALVVQGKTPRFLRGNAGARPARRSCGPRSGNAGAGPFPCPRHPVIRTPARGTRTPMKAMPSRAALLLAAVLPLLAATTACGDDAQEASRTSAPPTPGRPASGDHP